MTDDELNRAVAERVMGLPWEEARFKFPYGFHPAAGADHTALVMERMRDEGWTLLLEDGPLGASAMWTRGDKSAPYPRGKDDIWTRAVCMAALAAKEG
jgi:hypothetical protein